VNLDSLTVALSKAPIAHALFFASLLIFEIRFFKYWLHGTLGRILIESAGIAILAFLSGRRALGEVMERRSVKG
jgi:oligosaccharyltransferase complex subunit delta (ribophorin II)